jgi:hypothetical protein
VRRDAALKTLCILENQRHTMIAVKTAMKTVRTVIITVQTTIVLV